MNKHEFVILLFKEIKENKTQYLKSLNEQQIQKIKIYIIDSLSNNLHFSHCSIYSSVLFHFFPNLKKNFSHVFIEELREENNELRKEGAICVICDQHSREYKRTLSSNSARFLISLYTLHKNELSKGKSGRVHYKDCVFTSRDYPWLAAWGLAVTHNSDDGKKRTTGLWKPTKKGIDFVLNKTKIPKYLTTYKGKVVSVDRSTLVSITDCLGKRFNYSELMSSDK